MKVLLFGMLADDIGKAVIEMEQAKDVHALKNQLQVKYPVLRGKNFQIAVNHEKVENNMLLNEGDEIALMPPFAGG